MNKIRIAIIRQKFRFDGGAEQFISRILESPLTKQNNLEFHLITRKWKENTCLNYNIHICNPPITGRFSREYKFALYVRNFLKKKKFDIIQSHERISDCDIFRAGDGLHKAWLKQHCRIISIYHRLFIKISKFHQYLLLEEKKMFSSPKLKKIICNSNMIKNDIIKLYNVHPKKITTIYNFVDSNYFIPANDLQIIQTRKILNIPYNACVLIFVGSGFYRKGLKQTLFSLLNTNRYLIVIGKDKQLYSYHALAKSLGIWKKIRFIGTQQNTIPYYHASDALIIPSLYDPFPNVILEAMSCGLPVITSFQCGGSEIIIQEKNGFVCDSLDIKTLKIFINLIKPKQKDFSMGEHARKTACNYTFKKFFNKIINLYK